MLHVKLPRIDLRNTLEIPTPAVFAQYNPNQTTPHVEYYFFFFKFQFLNIIMICKHHVDMPNVYTQVILLVICKGLKYNTFVSFLYTLYSHQCIHIWKRKG